MKLSKLTVLAIVSLVLILSAGPLMAQNNDKMTKYPIALVPGVFAWGELFGVYDHFYNIENKLEDYFGGNDWVHYMDLNPWQDTEARGLELANQIEELCAREGYEKVNLIAHSHGSTTSRVAMTLTDKIASLTTIAGPHYGTPMADAMVEESSDWFFKMACSILNLSSDVVDIFSTGKNYIRQSDSEAVFNDFTQSQMEEFNNKYKSAGLPEGGTYGLKQYGADAAQNQSYWGNGFGDVRYGHEEDAIRFYSLTGNIGNKATAPWSFDMADIVTVITDFYANSYDYHGDADGFVPVSSSIFGEQVGEYKWNHCDEINQLMGLVGATSASPVSVYKSHISRLKLAGL